MTDPLALVVYEVHGTFPPTPPVASAAAYRLDPALAAARVVDVARVDRPADLAARRTGVAWQWFVGDHPALAARVAAAPQAMIIRAEVERPESPAYLRHAIGLAQLLLDHGGVAVHDVQTLRWYTPEEWRAELFDDVLRPHAHVVILTSVDGDLAWIHTRGLRKLGRPDLSVRAPQARRDDAIALVNREIVSLARGGHVAGATIVGDLDDPDYNNVHVELRLGTPE